MVSLVGGGKEREGCTNHESYAILLGLVHGETVRWTRWKSEMNRIDAHLHLARISCFLPAQLADPIILLSFGGWGSAVVSGRGLHVYGCMVFGSILRITSAVHCCGE